MNVWYLNLMLFLSVEKTSLYFKDIFEITVCAHVRCDKLSERLSADSHVGLKLLLCGIIPMKCLVPIAVNIVCLYKADRSTKIVFHNIARFKTVQISLYKNVSSGGQPFRVFILVIPKYGWNYYGSIGRVAIKNMTWWSNSIQLFIHIIILYIL